MDAQETRRLLELAARAAGYEVCEPFRNVEFRVSIPPSHKESFPWAPHEDDGDSFRLAVALEIDVLHRVVGGKRVEAIAPGGWLKIEYCTKETRAAATRLAVLRAAADVGEQMENTQS